MEKITKWVNRGMVIALLALSCVILGGTAYAAEVTMGSGGNLIFEPSEITIKARDTITFVNGELPPHNMIVKDHPELSHSDLAFMGGESFEVTFPESGEYEFQCDPHAGAGMKGVIHVE